MQFQEGSRPTYIHRFPFRFVLPYSHTYQTHAKQRWLGKPLLQVLAKQFLAYSKQYFQQAILKGKIRINGKIVEPQYVVKNSDLLEHETVRQQPPILDLPIQILYDSQNFLVVNKPPSMIVHTGGGYHYNTMMAILFYQMGFKNLYILHRIDRLTSGLIILAKKKQKTTKFHEQSMQEVMKKCYYARVQGNFPFQQKIIEAPLVCISHKQGMWAVYNAEKMKQIKNLQPKQSCTKFTKIWYDEKSDSSLLECYPITGRTHQIRVHLQHLGHPILNDVVYGGRFVGNWIVNQIQKIQEQCYNNAQVEDKIQKKAKLDKYSVEQNQDKKEQIQNWLSKWDYKDRPLQIFLHSIKYKFEGNQYVGVKPYWIDPQLVKIEKQINRQQKSKQETKIKSDYETEFLRESKKQMKKVLKEGGEGETKQDKQEKLQKNKEQSKGIQIRTIQTINDKAQQ